MFRIYFLPVFPHLRANSKEKKIRQILFYHKRISNIQKLHMVFCANNYFALLKVCFHILCFLHCISLLKSLIWSTNVSSLKLHPQCRKCTRKQDVATRPMLGFSTQWLLASLRWQMRYNCKGLESSIRKFSEAITTLEGKRRFHLWMAILRQ